MANINRFLAKGKEYDFEGEQISLKPLTVKNMDMFVELSSPSQEKKMRAVASLMEYYLRQAFPEAGDSVKDFDVSYMEKFMDFILDVNNMNVSEEEKAKAIGVLGK